MNVYLLESKILVLLIDKSPTAATFRSQGLSSSRPLEKKRGPGNEVATAAVFCLVAQRCSLGVD